MLLVPNEGSRTGAGTVTSQRPTGKAFAGSKITNAGKGEPDIVLDDSQKAPMDVWCVLTARSFEFSIAHVARC